MMTIYGRTAEYNELVGFTVTTNTPPFGDIEYVQISNDYYDADDKECAWFWDNFRVRDLEANFRDAILDAFEDPDEVSDHTKAFWIVHTRVAYNIWRKENGIL